MPSQVQFGLLIPVSGSRWKQCGVGNLALLLSLIREVASKPQGLSENVPSYPQSSPYATLSRHTALIKLEMDLSSLNEFGIDEIDWKLFWNTKFIL